MKFKNTSEPTKLRKRMIVHQFDPMRPSPGGIDTCIRGLSRYSPDSEELYVVGVDATGGARKSLGVWEKHSFGARQINFLPVARLDPNEQQRRLPHSLRLVLGLLRYRGELPRVDVRQAHRADVAAALLLRRGPLTYMVHTQRSGLTGSTSDSFWRKAARLHEALEMWVAKRASDVVVFNPDYAGIVQKWNERAFFSPTWYDPLLVSDSSDIEPIPHRICWVGRLETPKDPQLAISAFEKLIERSRGERWELHIAGAGSLLNDLRVRIQQLPENVKSRIRLLGRRSPQQVAELMASSGTFLMTSHPGYEGFPRVLVEAMAAGLTPVVTDGSDTGGLVREGVTGYVRGRDPKGLADALLAAPEMRREAIKLAARELSAPVVVGKIFSRLASS